MWWIPIASHYLWVLSHVCIVIDCISSLSVSHNLYVPSGSLTLLCNMDRVHIMFDYLPIEDCDLPVRYIKYLQGNQQNWYMYWH